MNQNTLILKVGTNVLTQKNGLLNKKVLKSLVKQICKIQKKGYHVIFVSSGAMGAGRSLVQLKEKTSDITKRQVLAAVGQAELMQRYQKYFKKQGSTCAQVLATKEDFRDKSHYLNMKNCFDGLLENGITPIVNENDTVSVDELMFTDNDELASLIAAMMNAQKLIILSNVEGIFTGHPEDPQSTLIKEVKPGQAIEEFIQKGTSSFGRGGMRTKVQMAEKLAKMGIETIIAKGTQKDILIDIVDGKDKGTRFLKARSKTQSATKRRMASSAGYEKGTITINNCAQEVLKEKIASLLPVGITKVTGDFNKGDTIKIQNETGENIGYGIAAYDAKKAKEFKGKKNKKALIHYNYLYLT